MSKQFYEDVLQKRSPWYSELTLFDSRWHPSVTTALWGDGFMHLDIKGPDGEGVYFPDPVPGAPPFSDETWHTMAVELDSAAVAYLYQDGRLVMKGELQPTSQKELIGVHGGPIYGGPTFTLGAYVLVDNFELVCGQ